MEISFIDDVLLTFPRMYVRTYGQTLFVFVRPSFQSREQTLRFLENERRHSSSLCSVISFLLLEEMSSFETIECQDFFRRPNTCSRESRDCGTDSMVLLLLTSVARVVESNQIGVVDLRRTESVGDERNDGSNHEERTNRMWRARG